MTCGEFQKRQDRAETTVISEEWKCPDKMYLAAYQMGEEIISYKEDERPEVSAVYAGNGRLVCRKEDDLELCGNDSLSVFR